MRFSHGGHNKEKVARMICDVHYPDGRPFELDPRYILKKVVKEAEEMGYTLKASPECEFFPLPHRRGWNSDNDHT